MGTRSNLKFESPPNPRGILALTNISNLILSRDHDNDPFLTIGEGSAFKSAAARGYNWRSRSFST